MPLDEASPCNPWHYAAIDEREYITPEDITASITAGISRPVLHEIVLRAISARRCEDSCLCAFVTIEFEGNVPADSPKGRVVFDPKPGWARAIAEQLVSGAHVVLFAFDRKPVFEARRAGLTVRDSLVILDGNRLRTAWLLRMPMEGTVAAQVLATGTGAMWIDGCRIESGGTHDSATSVGTGKGHADTFNNGRFGKGLGGVVQPPHPSGRWPTNLLLAHKPGCKRDGMRKVPTGTAVRHRGVTEGSMGRLGRLAEGTPDLGYADEDGNETIPAWTCEPGCSVAALDAQSGIRTSGAFNQASKKAENRIYGKHEAYTDPKMYEANEGGASRFYPQLEGDDAIVAWLERLIGL